jgi:hypothetical protein
MITKNGCDAEIFLPPKLLAQMATGKKKNFLPVQINNSRGSSCADLQACPL